MQVVLEGVVGGGYLGDIALDDVTLKRHANCSLFPSNAQSNTSGIFYIVVSNV